MILLYPYSWKKSSVFYYLPKKYLCIFTFLFFKLRKKPQIADKVQKYDYDRISRNLSAKHGIRSCFDTPPFLPITGRKSGLVISMKLCKKLPADVLFVSEHKSVRAV